MVIDLNKLKLPSFNRFRIIEQGGFFIPQRRFCIFLWVAIGKYSLKSGEVFGYTLSHSKYSFIQQAELCILEYKRDELKMKTKTYIKGFK